MPTESIMGFILRTAEMNGYRSPSDILRYAGMTENEIRSARPPIDKLARLYARHPDDFCYMGSKSIDAGRRNKQWRILNQIVPALYVNVKLAKICPECILEDKCIDGFLDLRHAVACPTHARMTITACPSCNKPLNWSRPGLLTCSCGQNLSKLRGAPVEDPLALDMLELVKRKLHGDPIHIQRLSDRGFPLPDIDNLSVATLLGIIGRLQPGNKRKTQFNVPIGLKVEMHALKLASGMLSNWPHGFYDYLEIQYQQNPKVLGSTLHKQFRRFYFSFFKSGLPANEVAFLENAFMNFGNDRWRTNGFIDPRFSNRMSVSSNIVGMKGLAEHLGIMVPTAENYVKKGYIQGVPKKTAKSTRLVFDLTKISFKKSEGKYYRLRDAAVFVGLPVALLQLLKQRGVYKISRLGWGMDGFSELDLIEFREKLISLAPILISLDTANLTSMKQIFRKKLGGQNISLKLIAETISGDIVPYGRIGDAIGDIVFKEVDIKKMLINLEIRLSN